MGGGQLKGGLTNIRVRTVGEEHAATEIANLPLRTRTDGSIVRLSDVAVVREGFEDQVEREP